MAKLPWYIIILIISLILAIVHGVIIAPTPSAHIIVSWIFIGFWLCFTVKFLQRVRSQRDLNSPLNTGFFTLNPLLVGLIYSFEGYFTGLLEWNIFGPLDIYLSPWILLFAFPYLLYGSFSLYFCCTRYDFVYLGQKSFNARRYGVVISGIMFLLVFIYILYFYTVLDTVTGPFPPTHTSLDLMLLVLCSFTLYLIIRYGVFGRRTDVGQISARIAAQRQRRLTTQPASRPRPQERTPTPVDRKPKPVEHKPTPVERKPKPPERQPHVVERKPKPEAKSDIKAKFKRFRPVAGVLSLDDFKCIFCFKLPEYPADQARGIVLCPLCKHPAHADEFKSWTKTSPLCSRCNQTIPAAFRRNPEIIRTKDYLTVVKAYYNHMQKK